MEKYYLTFILIFSSIVFAQNKSPKIFSPSPNHDFGEILEGQIVTHSFEIINKGTSDLKLDNVKASCGCTAVQPAKKILKPGEKTTIRIEFDSHGRLGLQQKFVYVFSNDKENPQLKLSFNASVVEKLTSKNGNAPKLVLSQNQYDFGNVEEGKLVDVKIGLQNTGNGELEIKEVKTSCGCTAALLSSKKLKPGESGDLRIELDTSNREGKLTRTVTLLTNDPDQSNHTITLFVNIEKRKP